TVFCCSRAVLAELSSFTLVHQAAAFSDQFERLLVRHTMQSIDMTLIQPQSTKPQASVLFNDGIGQLREMLL
ncbi:hypothetical protein OFC87_33790, partial [Escherichia coli]|nr:hypothetical protein [Escherichia coli]